MITEQVIREAFPRDPWPHQFRGVTETLRALEEISSLCLSAVTGSGKTIMQAAIVNLCIKYGYGCIIYNARRPLTNQVSRVLEEAQIHHGARAASMKSQQNLHALIQCGSIQTDVQRVVRQKCWEPHRARYVIIDEAHMPQCKSEKAQQLYQMYLAQGAKLIGMTGTPVGLSHIYKDILDLASNSEMRELGAHVPAETYAIHEMDVSRIKPVKTGEYREGDIRRECWSNAIVGYAYDDWLRLNPDGRPTLASCPGVQESVWVTNEWRAKGLRTLHIDAKECVIKGERYKNDLEGTVREQALEEARNGKFELTSNCEVLLAGIDIPCIEHLIMLRPFGSFSNYIQFGGRGIRASEGKDRCVIQDHVGNIHRWGSINENRDWAEYFFMTENEVYQSEQQKRQDNANNDGLEPITCGNCGKVRACGVTCPKCGHKSDKSQRVIVQQDGTLMPMEGRVFKKKRVKAKKSVEQKKWDSLMWGARKKGSNLTFRSAAAIMQKEFGEFPRDLKFVPRDQGVWKQKIKDTEWKDLK